jgi:hypothetical protein
MTIGKYLGEQIRLGKLHQNLEPKPEGAWLLLDHHPFKITEIAYGEDRNTIEVRSVRSQEAGACVADILTKDDCVFFPE